MKRWASCRNQRSLDPDYTRQVHVELNNVTLEEALNHLIETKTLASRNFEHHFVAQDSPAKRKELKQNVIKPLSF